MSLIRLPLFARITSTVSFLLSTILNYVLLPSYFDLLGTVSAFSLAAGFISKYLSRQVSITDLDSSRY